ncbi:histidine phosphatase superfamily [Infundibulicybe gibba]|nr:histidine phosphatase superfamily [Infundibulicybe gibba]
MSGQDAGDVEAGREYKAYEAENEHDALLPEEGNVDKISPPSDTPRRIAGQQFGWLHVSAAFLSGLIACFILQYAACGPECFKSSSSGGSATPNSNHENALAPPYVGSTEVHNFPPAAPTNAFSSLFPTNVGYPGGTPTGAEPAVIATAPAYPIHTGAAQLVLPATLGKKVGKIPKEFDMFKKWGNLSPWFSVDRTAFGLDSGPEAPDTCRVTGLHFLHRHGARYPTQWASYGGPAKFAKRMNDNAAKWNASGNLDFLNEWTYKLGEECMSPCTPVGRSPMLTLMTGSVNTVWETATVRSWCFDAAQIWLPAEELHGEQYHSRLQDRISASDARVGPQLRIGFFGYPFEGKYQQSITIEAPGFNNTLAPYDTCPNANAPGKANRSMYYMKQWVAIYLEKARTRLQAQISGLELTIEDIYMMQQMCPYETVALGYSKFCELFTAEEWEGFNYALDLIFWYDSSFGSPVARVQGIGYIQELVARLTHTPIEHHNSSTNSTLNDSPITFPLGQSLYVDATHEVVVLNIITALNLTTFAASGPLPPDHIPANRSFRSSELAPFATNIQFQLLSCAAVPGPQIRIIINDGVVPLTGIRGCPEQRDGMCPVDTFVAAQREIIRQTDWTHDCEGDWTVPPGPAWNTTTGDAPK